VDNQEVNDVGMDNAKKNQKLKGKAKKTLAKKIPADQSTGGTQAGPLEGDLPISDLTPPDEQPVENAGTVPTEDPSSTPDETIDPLAKSSNYFFNGAIFRIDYYNNELEDNDDSRWYEPYVVLFSYLVDGDSGDEEAKPYGDNSSSLGIEYKGYWAGEKETDKLSSLKNKALKVIRSQFEAEPHFDEIKFLYWSFI
jgi:hypothetical protein